MLRQLQQRERSARILMGIILTVISMGMLLYLVPTQNMGGLNSSPDTVARVGNSEITVDDVQTVYQRQTRGQSVPAMYHGMYMHQILDGMVFEKALDFEAQRLGVRVTNEEQTQRIKLFLPSAFTGDTWIGKDRYADEVRTRTGMSVEEFEDYVRSGLLQEKFRQVVTDSVQVTPAEVEEEFRRRNEKIKIEYALVKPADLAASVNPSESEVSEYFQKNAASYQIPERRSARYALLSQDELRRRAAVTEDELRTYYDQHQSEYKIPNRVHVEHILFKTVGKTDAEVAEIRQKAEDVLKKAKAGGNFEDLAKKYSEDTTKDKGGDLGWIVQGQTVAEFEKAAFTLPKGAVSDLVKTVYGFHIIKVLDHQDAHAQSLDEVRAQILPYLQEQKLNRFEDQMMDQISAAVRKSNRQPMEEIAKNFGMKLAETSLMSLAEPVGELGNSTDVHQKLFQLQPGEISMPLRLDAGIAVLSVKQVQPVHSATLAEVRDQIVNTLRQQKAGELARARAEELSKRLASGEPLAKAAKSLGMETKTTDSFSRTSSVPDLGSAGQFEAAFSLKAGQSGPAIFTSGGWLVYAVAEHQDVDPAEFTKNRTQIEQELLQSKQEAAFDAFHVSLISRLKKEGKLIINDSAVKRLASNS